MTISRQIAELGEICLMGIVTLCFFSAAIAGPMFFYHALWLVVESIQHYISSGVAQIVLYTGLGLCMTAIFKRLYRILARMDELSDLSMNVTNKVVQYFGK